jgi:pimeloyl-ACP methyl ester carboxylesterase
MTSETDQRWEVIDPARGAEVHKRFVETSFGRIAYLEAGAADRPPVLFIHGIPTSSYLWRHVLRFLQNDLHCLAPDLMGLGDSEVDPGRVPLHMEAQAEMLEEFMAALGHRRFAMVCHDQGGAAAQLLAAHRPALITSWVITNCVCYDNWPVPAVARLQRLMRVPLLPDLLLRTRLFHLHETRSPTSMLRRGLFEGRRLSNAAIEEYLRPLTEGPRARERYRSFILAGSPVYTQRAVEGMRRFDKPTLVIWAAEDRYLSPSWGRRLAEEIPGVERFELVPFCGHFWQEERPAEFCALMGEFLARHARRAGEGQGSEVRDAG